MPCCRTRRLIIKNLGGGGSLQPAVVDPLLFNRHCHFPAFFFILSAGFDEITAPMPSW
jgi:hypothetical protein